MRPGPREGAHHEAGVTGPSTGSFIVGPSGSFKRGRGPKHTTRPGPRDGAHYEARSGSPPPLARLEMEKGFRPKVFAKIDRCYGEKGPDPLRNEFYIPGLSFRVPARRSTRPGP